GAHLVYVDLDPDTMNIEPEAIARAISSKTKAVVIMHYAGIACKMPPILELCEKHGLYLIEDAAHCIQASYEQQHLGTFGHLGTFSFHHTKNIHCGEGGALLVNDPDLAARAQTIRDKGTNRQAFLRGEVEKYSWVDIGSSYLLNELSAAFLLAQLEALPAVTQKRQLLWQRYFDALSELDSEYLQLPQVPGGCAHNGHLFYFQCKSPEVRTRLLAHLNGQGIGACFHYVPLHSSKAGLQWGHFDGKDQYTTVCSRQLIRLPLYFKMTLDDCQRVVDSINRFYAWR
ncbi:MAG: dTDP-4-amino-4,6-dideoxygalactose transaminase, partial [Phaeodactylibacter sp.]|nr:dTDP-4-amino-4,6-dideoxygalactose transaminase [Phaeodactylibacter sp.]